MVNNLTNSFYKVVINCFVLEFTINGRACNAQLIHDARNGDTAVFDGFLKDFALMWHIVKLGVTLMQICTERIRKTSMLQ